VKRANDATSRRAARPRVGGSMPEARVGGDRTPATPAVTTRPSSVAEALGLERNIVEVAELDLHFLRVSSHRVNFGSDSLWYGSPQWQIEAFWRFQIPEKLQEKWDYPEITDADKRNIIGLNSARLYHVPSTIPKKFGPVPSDFESRIPADLKTLLEFPGFASDNLSKMKARYLAEGAVPDHTRYGWIRTMV